MRARRILTYLGLGGFSVVWLIPIFILVLTALKSESFFMYNPPWALPPLSGINFLDNVGRVWGAIGGAFLNTVLYSLVSAATAVFLASLVAYPVSKINFRGRQVIFTLVLIGTFLPFQMYLVPHLLITRALGLFDSRLGLILVYTAICIPFATLVMRNYFVTIPNELMESARLDGLSHFKIYRRVIMPLAIPALVVAFLFQYLWVWNNMVFGLVLASSPSTTPLMTSLAYLTSSYEASFTLLATGIILAVVVPLAVVFAFQKKFTRGFTAAWNV